MATLLSSDGDLSPSSRVLFMLGICDVRVARCLLFSLLLLPFACGKLILGTSFALAADTHIRFSGVYSYCDAPTSWNSKPRGTITLTGGDTFKPTNNICIGITDIEVVRLADPGTKVEGESPLKPSHEQRGYMIAPDGAKIDLSNGKSIYVLRKVDTEEDLKEDNLDALSGHRLYVSYVRSKLNADNKRHGVYLRLGSQIIGSNKENEEIRLIADIANSHALRSGNLSIALMDVIGNTDKVTTVSGVGIKLVANFDNSVAALVVGRHTRFINSPVSGEGISGQRMVLFYPNDGDSIYFNSTISGTVSVFAIRGTTTLGEEAEGADYFPNTYSGGTYADPEAKIRGHTRAFGSGPIKIYPAGKVEVISSKRHTNSAFSNNVLRIGRASDRVIARYGNQAVLMKSGRNNVIFTGALTEIVLEVYQGKAILGQDEHFLDIVAKLHNRGVLGLGGKSRTIRGLESIETSEDTDDRAPSPVVSGGEGELLSQRNIDFTIDVKEGDEFVFDGKISGITKLIKKGKGKQTLTGIVHSTWSRDTIPTEEKLPDGVVIYEGDLEVKYNTLSGGDVFLGGVSADAARLVVKDGGVFESFVRGHFTETGASGKGTVLKTGAGSVTFTEPMIGVVLEISRGTAMLGQEEGEETDIEVILNHVHERVSPVQLYLSERSSFQSRTIKGLHTRKDVTVATGTPPRLNGAEAELVIDVEADKKFIFDGNIILIKKLIKRGQGEQALIGAVSFLSDSSSEETALIIIEEGLLEVKYDTFPGYDFTFTGENDAKLAVTSADENIQEFASNIVALTDGGTISLVKRGTGTVKFTGNLSVDAFHVEEGKAILASLTRSHDGFPNKVPALIIKKLIYREGNTGNWNAISLGGDWTITGISNSAPKESNIDVSESTVVSGRLNRSPELTSELHRLTIRVPKNEERVFYGDIDDFKQIVIDGHGVQKFFGKVTRDARKDPEDADSDLIVDPDESIVRVTRGSKLHIRADTFEDLPHAPLDVDDGGVLVIEDPSVQGKKFRNPIRGNGSLSFGGSMGIANLHENVDLSFFLLEVIESFDLRLPERRIFRGLSTKNRNASVYNSHRMPGPLVLDVPKGDDYLFLGRLAPNLNITKRGKGRQTFGIAELHTGAINVEDGSLILHIGWYPGEANTRSRTAAGEAGEANTRSRTTVTRIEAPITAAANAEIDLVMWLDATELANKLSLHKNAKVRIRSGSDSGSQGSIRRVIYSNTEQSVEIVSSIELLEKIDFSLGKDVANPGTLASHVIVGKGAKIRGSGLINGDVVVMRGGVVVPGHSVGDIRAKSWVLNSGSSVTIKTMHLGGNSWKTAMLSVRSYGKGISIEKGVTLRLLKPEGAPDTVESYLGEKIILKKHTEGRFGRIDTSDLDGKIQPVIEYKTSGQGQGNVYLSWRKFDPKRFEKAGNTFNQKGVGANIDKMGVGNIAYQILAALPEDSVPGVLNLLSGEIYTAGMKVILESFVMLDSIVARRTQEVLMQNRIYCYDEIILFGSRLSRGICEKKEAKLATWSVGLVNYSRVKGSEEPGNSNLHSFSGGGIAGMDWMVGSKTLGLALAKVIGSYGIKDTASGAARDSKGHFDSYYVTMYASSYLNGGWGVAGNVGVSSHYLSVSRNISVANADFSESVESKHKAFALRFAGEVVKLDFAGLRGSGSNGHADLFFRLDRGLMSDGAFSEHAVSGTRSISLSGQGSEYNTLSHTAGVRLLFWSGFGDLVSHPIVLSSMFGWRYKWTEANLGSKLKFTGALDDGTSGSYTVSAGSFAKNSAILGLDVLVKDRISDIDAFMIFAGRAEVSRVSLSGGFSVGVRLLFY